MIHKRGKIIFSTIFILSILLIILPISLTHFSSAIASCPPGQSYYLGVCVYSGCIPNCDSRVCGDDGCGGSCGICLLNQECYGGQCLDSSTVLNYPLLPPPLDEDPIEEDTSDEMSCNKPSCEEQDISCGITPDGCGSYLSCGTCPTGQQCISGNCVLISDNICYPDCSGKTCGDDGCGGTCGTCPPEKTCKVGTCQDLYNCYPDCSGKTCGDDGCGGTCGNCLNGETCVSGNCEGNSEVCYPDCAGKTCGSDGCGGSCGVCYVDETCNNGQCESTCISKTCGELSISCGYVNDGCGKNQFCGACPYGESCINGNCEDNSENCLPDCASKTCGDDGCGGSCGSCFYPDICTQGNCETSSDENTCIPDCSAKACGSDGCTGSCGSCDSSFSCTNGICVSDSSDEIDPEVCTLISREETVPDCTYPNDDDSSSCGIFCGILGGLVISDLDNLYEKKELTKTNLNLNEKLEKFLSNIRTTGNFLSPLSLSRYERYCSFKCEDGTIWNGEECEPMCDENACEKYDLITDSCKTTCDGCNTCNNGECTSSCDYYSCESCWLDYETSEGSCQTPTYYSGNSAFDSTTCNFCFNGQNLPEVRNEKACESCTGESIEDICTNPQECLYSSMGKCLSSCFENIGSNSFPKSPQECVNNNGIGECETLSANCQEPISCTQTIFETWNCGGTTKYKTFIQEMGGLTTCSGDNACTQSGELCSPPQSKNKVCINPSISEESRTEKLGTFVGNGKGCYGTSGSIVTDPEGGDYGIKFNTDSAIYETGFLPTEIKGLYLDANEKYIFKLFSRIDKICDECETCDPDNPDNGCIANPQKDGQGCTYYGEDEITKKTIETKGVCQAGICEIDQGKTCTAQGDECSSCEYCKVYNNEEIIEDGNTITYLNIKPNKEITKEIIIKNEFETVIEYEVSYQGNSYLAPDLSNLFEEPLKGTLKSGEQKTLHLKYKTNLEDKDLKIKVTKNVPNKASLSSQTSCLDLYYNTFNTLCSSQDMDIQSIIYELEQKYSPSLKINTLRDERQRLCLMIFRSKYGTNYPIVLDKNKKTVCEGAYALDECIYEYINSNPLDCFRQSEFIEEYNFIFKAEPKIDKNGVCAQNPSLKSLSNPDSGILCSNENGEEGCCKDETTYDSTTGYITTSTCEVIEDECTTHDDCGVGEYCTKGEKYVRRMWTKDQENNSIQIIYVRNYEGYENYNGEFEVSNILGNETRIQIIAPPGVTINSETDFIMQFGEIKTIEFSGTVPDGSSSYILVKKSTTRGNNCGTVTLTIDENCSTSNCSNVIETVNNLSEEFGAAELNVSFILFSDLSPEQRENINFSTKIEFNDSCTSTLYTAKDGVLTEEGENIDEKIREYISEVDYCDILSIIKEKIQIKFANKLSSCLNGMCKRAPELNWTFIDFYGASVPEEGGIYFLPFSQFTRFSVKGGSKNNDQCMITIVSKDDTEETITFTGKDASYFEHDVNGFFEDPVIYVNCDGYNSPGGLCLPDEIEQEPYVDLCSDDSDSQIQGNSIPSRQCFLHETMVTVSKEYDGEEYQLENFYHGEGGTLDELTTFYMKTKGDASNRIVRYTRSDGLKIKRYVKIDEAYANLLKAVQMHNEILENEDLSESEKKSLIRSKSLVSSTDMKALEEEGIIYSYIFELESVNDFDPESPHIFAKCYHKLVPIRNTGVAMREKIYIFPTLEENIAFRLKTHWVKTPYKGYTGDTGNAQIYKKVEDGWYMHDARGKTVSLHALSSDYNGLSEIYTSRAAFTQAILTMPFMAIPGYDTINFAIENPEINDENYNLFLKAVVTDVGSEYLGLGGGVVIGEALGGTFRLIKGTSNKIKNFFGFVDIPTGRVKVVVETTADQTGSMRYRYYDGQVADETLEFNRLSYDQHDDLILRSHKDHAEKVTNWWDVNPKRLPSGEVVDTVTVSGKEFKKIQRRTGDVYYRDDEIPIPILSSRQKTAYIDRKTELDALLSNKNTDECLEEMKDYFNMPINEMETGRVYAWRGSKTPENDLSITMRITNPTEFKESDLIELMQIKDPKMRQNYVRQAYNSMVDQFAEESFDNVYRYATLDRQIHFNPNLYIRRLDGSRVHISDFVTSPENIDIINELKREHLLVGVEEMGHALQSFHYKLDVIREEVELKIITNEMSSRELDGSGILPNSPFLDEYLDKTPIEVLNPFDEMNAFSRSSVAEVDIDNYFKSFGEHTGPGFISRHPERRLLMQSGNEILYKMGLDGYHIDEMLPIISKADVTDYSRHTFKKYTYDTLDRHGDKEAIDAIKERIRQYAKANGYPESYGIGLGLLNDEHIASHITKRYFYGGFDTLQFSDKSTGVFQWNKNGKWVGFCEFDLNNEVSKIFSEITGQRTAYLSRMSAIPGETSIYELAPSFIKNSLHQSAQSGTKNIVFSTNKDVAKRINDLFPTKNVDNAVIADRNAILPYIYPAESEDLLYMSRGYETKLDLQNGIGDYTPAQRNDLISRIEHDDLHIAHSPSWLDNDKVYYNEIEFRMFNVEDARAFFASIDPVYKELPELRVNRILMGDFDSDQLLRIQEAERLLTVDFANPRVLTPKERVSLILAHVYEPYSQIGESTYDIARVRGKDKLLMEGFDDAAERRLLMENNLAGAKFKLKSDISDHKYLVDTAEELPSEIEKKCNDLVERYANGNANPGLGTEILPGNLRIQIKYLRSRNGARVFFKENLGTNPPTMTILAKASKASEPKVISFLRSEFRQNN